jgi:hypothetical protein
MGPSSSDSDIIHLRSLTTRSQDVAGETPDESSRGLLAREVSNPKRGPSTWVIRTLLAALIVVLLVPSATIGAMVWQGVIRPPWSTNVVLGNDSQPLSVTLTAPSSIEAERGKEVPFRVTLNSVNPFPPGSIVTVQGLPEGTKLSRGRPYGEREWTLRPDEIGDLRLFLPRATSGYANLSIRLVAGDGTIIASAATQLNIAVAHKTPLISRPDETGRIADLIAHGQKMIDLGQIEGARSYFKRAAEAGSADAAYALGMTYEPSFINDAGARGMKGDPAEARAWYERARELGSEAAKEKLEELKRPARESLRT